MPSALETLVKILKLEREQGGEDKAVIGGLASFSRNWVKDAHAQARKPEHHVLVDELQQIMTAYGSIESRTERLNQIQYMLDRITGRVPPPPEFAASLEEKPAESPPEREPQARSKPEPPPPADTRSRKRQPVDDFVSDEGYDRGRQGRQLARDLPAQVRLARPPRTKRPPMDTEEALDVMRGLRQPVTIVKGVGDRMAEAFANLGITTLYDLLYFLPRRYDDYTRLNYISKLLPNQVATVIATVRSAQVTVGANRRKDFHLTVDDGSGLMDVVFFGQHFMSRYIKPDQQIVLSGTTSIFRSRLQMSNPEWEHLDSDNLHTVGIVPVYPLTQGLKARGLRRLMNRAVTYWADRLPDHVPEATLDRTELAELGWALQNIHFPQGNDHLEHARRRLAFDELLLMQLAILRNRWEWQSVPAVPLAASDEFVSDFLRAVFPYELTAAQTKAVADLRLDIGQNVPMNRLLQGDVGSGKTAVATTALALAVANGYQAALMAPTSILAEQHYRNISAALARMPGEQTPRIALLTGSLSSSERDAVRAGMAEGAYDIVIGTHALIQEGVNFQNLALAVIDEQHRFGVEQRGALRGKGTNPHLLVMTATPIPRTLALTLHADLDLTVIDELPPGRQPVQTRVIEPVARERVFSFVESQLNQGRQAFIVHPLVEESETIDARSATEAYEELQKIFFRFKVGLLHGRMRPAEKDEIMQAFSQGDYDVLVTTSVAEVGVDVPNASVMVIEGANRFGLAQLHQFRGRVGRGEHASYCLLFPDNNTPEARERLQAMEDITDGFQLAEMDWKLRGPGDLLGTRQSGGFQNSHLKVLDRLAQYVTPQMVELAQREARTIYAEDPLLSQEQHQLLAERVQLLLDDRSDVS
jgi:ATP-dependent DNA helicase RecG